MIGWGLEVSRFGVACGYTLPSCAELRDLLSTSVPPIKKVRMSEALLTSAGTALSLH